MNWLLLRGLTREKRHWGTFYEQFCDFAGGSKKVLLLDHAGVGDQLNLPIPKSIEGMATELRSRWLEQKSKYSNEPWGILSISLGSMVSLQWCSTYTNDFAVQVIVNTSTAKFSKPWNRLLPASYPSLIELTKSVSNLEREVKVLDLCTNLLSEEDKIAYASEWGNFSIEKAQLRKIAATQLFAATSYNKLPATKVPTLTLVSAADRLVSPNCSIEIANYLGSQVEIHPRAGHELCLDDPQWVIEQIKNWDLFEPASVL